MALEVWGLVMMAAVVGSIVCPDGELEVFVEDVAVPTRAVAVASKEETSVLPVCLRPW
jgi:hypothetical protein